MDRFAKQLGVRIKQARTARGFTQAHLATLASVGANYVPRLERGEMTPSVDAAYRLAQALGVSVDELCATTTRRDPMQEAARALGSLTEAEIVVLRRVVKAVEVLRSGLRGSVPPGPPSESRPAVASKDDDAPRSSRRRPPESKR